MHNLLRNVKVTNTSQIGGSTAVAYSSILDMRGYDGVAFIAMISGGPSTSAFGIKVQEASSSSMSTGSDVADLTGTSVTASSTTIADGFLAADIFRPNKQYVRMAMIPSAGSDTLSAIVALQYKAGDSPVTHSTGKNLGTEYFVSPSTGTA
ncbi:MAG: hypothetical protein Q7K03_08385 [Dehalococcoidia bacterium]|nr:hypothetical protein [Dehalococcoidia bacterium]